MDPTKLWELTWARKKTGPKIGRIHVWTMGLAWLNHIKNQSVLGYAWPLRKFMGKLLNQEVLLGKY